MGFFTAIKKFFGSGAEPQPIPKEKSQATPETPSNTIPITVAPQQSVPEASLQTAAQEIDTAASETSTQLNADAQTVAMPEEQPQVSAPDVIEEQSAAVSEGHVMSSLGDSAHEQSHTVMESTAFSDVAPMTDATVAPFHVGVSLRKEETLISAAAEAAITETLPEPLQVIEPSAELSSGVLPSATDADSALILRLREAEPRLSAWLAVVLDGVDEVGSLLWARLLLLLHALDAPEDEAQAFVGQFREWLERMEYVYVDEFRSELQYRLALALDLEDEEDERNRLFVKISEGLSRTREQLSRGLDALFASHGELDDAFWDEMEEIFIMADMGYEPSLELVRRLKERARSEKVTEASHIRELLMAEVEEIFRLPHRIVTVNPPEVVLMIGVNGVGKTTTIAKLAHRDRMQGKRVMIAAADTFRAAAMEQLQVWAERVGALFHAKPAGSDPASVAYEAMDRAVREHVDVLYVDTAGRLQTKVNLMEELGKIRQVLSKKHEGAPHRSILVIDATTGQNALSQTKLFKEAAGVDELIVTKLDGTAKGGVAIAVAMQYHLPISYVGLGEKLEDLRPFDGGGYARALLGERA